MSNLKDGSDFKSPNVETILSLKPDVVISSSGTPVQKLEEVADSVEGILSNSVLSGVNTVKNKNVYKMPQFLGSYDLPGPEVVVGIMWLSIFPKYFY